MLLEINVFVNLYVFLLKYKFLFSKTDVVSQILYYSMHFFLSSEDLVIEQKFVSKHTQNTLQNK